MGKNRDAETHICFVVCLWRGWYCLKQCSSIGLNSVETFVKLCFKLVDMILNSVGTYLRLGLNSYERVWNWLRHVWKFDRNVLRRVLTCVWNYLRHVWNCVETVCFNCIETFETDLEQFETYLIPFLKGVLILDLNCLESLWDRFDTCIETVWGFGNYFETSWDLFEIVSHIVLKKLPLRSRGRGTAAQSRF